MVGTGGTFISFVLGIIPTVDKTINNGFIMGMIKEDILFLFQIGALSITIFIGILTAVAWFKKYRKK